MAPTKRVRLSRQEREMKKLETGLRGWKTIVPRVATKGAKPVPAMESSSDDDVEVVVERVVIPGDLCLCSWCRVPCLATAEHGAMCPRCIAIPPAERCREDRVMEICKTCNKTFTYPDYPGRPYNGLNYCTSCRNAAFPLPAWVRAALAFANYSM